MKKKIVFINVVCNGSTGKIMCDLAKVCNKENYETYCFFGRGKKNKEVNSIKMSSELGTKIHGLLARLGFNGKGSYFSTKKLVKKLKEINPDIIHLHNIHGYFINIKVLFKYLKNEYKGKIIWTLHDCWSFTGHCSYFNFVNCPKWKTQCFKCPQLNAYPKEYFDTTKKEYKIKKELFTNINNLIIVTPSNWLKELVKKSYLKEYPIKVINNGIDLNIFKKEIDTNLFDKYNIPKDKKIILGVANIWEDRKGLKDFIELANVIDDDMKIVLVGLNEEQIKDLPDNIIGIKRTENQQELAKLYSLAHVFFNPTYEDNYPTTILESIACQTKVVSYDTGGCSESTLLNGIIINKKDYEALIKYVKKIKKEDNFINYELLDKNHLFKKYIDEIYEKEVIK